MNLEEVINQLKDLQVHCKEFADGDEGDSIWKDDVQALDIAIKILKDIPFPICTEDWRDKE